MLLLHWLSAMCMQRRPSLEKVGAGMRNPAGAAANEAKLHPTSVLIDRRTGRKWRLAHRLTHSRACR